MAFAHITQNEARIGQHQKQAAGHGEELPALRKNAADTGLECARDQANCQIKDKQFDQAQPYRFDYERSRDEGEQPFIEERKVGAKQRQ